MENIIAKYLATNNSLLKHTPWKRSRTIVKHWKFCEVLWRARLNDIRWRIIIGRTRHKILIQIDKHGIHGHTSERERSNQNPTEGVIREMRKKWHQEIFIKYCLRQLWSYRYPYNAKIM